MRKFPIIHTFETIPYNMLAQHKEQIFKNHNQTLDMLEERGGLDWVETYCILEDIAFNKNISDVDAKESVLNKINDYINDYQSNTKPPDKLELRSCIVRYPNNEKTISRNAYFHKWCDRSKIVDPSPLIGGHHGGIIQYTTAIVEYEDGSIDECSPHCIIFTDRR